VATVKGDVIAATPITNVSNSLAGRLPGVTAVTRSGEPGYDGSTIRIRGANTLGNNNALIVVDGIPNRSLDRIDPNSIESVTVLKDASAAIYGAQAANGVILITTKRGKVGKPQITVNYDHGFGRPTVIPEMANAAEYAQMLNEIDMYRNRQPRFSPAEIQKFNDGSDPWRYPDTDWFGAVLKPWSAQTNANAQLTGGNESMRYFVSVGTRFQDGYYHNSATHYKQHDFRTNLDGKISENVNLSVDVAGRQENRNFPVRGAGAIFRMVMRGKPNMPAFWPNGTPGPDIEYGDNPSVVSTDATGYDRDTWYVLNSNAKLNVNIPQIKGLSFTSNVGIDKGFRFRKRFETPWTLYSWDGSTVDANGEPVLIPGKKGFAAPQLRQDAETNQNILLNAMFNYETSIADHYLKFLVGTERISGQRDMFDAQRRFFVSSAVDQMFAGGDAEQRTGGSATQSARLNYFGRVNYNFLEKYMAEFVWRVDGSYIFPANKRFGFFPGISAGWRISEEGFWKNSLSGIENFKIRGSWGQTGNDRIDEYQFISSYAFGNPMYNNAPYIFGVNEEHKTLYESKIPNRNVTWEVANQSNVGIETMFFNGKVSVEADYFYNVRSQILWWRNASIPTSTGLTLPRENIGKVANKGFDFNVGYNGQAGEFRYRFGVNGGYARNEILFWDETPNVPEYQRSTGMPMNTGLYYDAIGIFRTQQDLDNNPKIGGARLGDIIFRDVNEDGKIDNHDRIRVDKNDLPRFTGGVTMNVQWKGFDLDVLLQGATGAVRYVNTESGDIGNFLRRHVTDRWTPENPNASFPRAYNRSEEYWRNRPNTFFLENTNYLRLKNLVFGYTLPASITQRFGTESLRLYVSGFNLLTFSPHLKDFDPESNNAAGTNYPLQKVVNAGVSLNF
jgi:TonB-linked SusC/RagA family outer membrane protein